MQFLRVMLAGMGALMLASCASSHDMAYLNHQNSQSMVVPKGVQAPMQQPLYALPTKKIAGKVGSVSLVPPGMAANATR